VDSTTYERFKITLEYDPDPTSSREDSCVRLQFGNWNTPREQVARDNFAHEFAHIAYSSLAGGDCPNWGLDAFKEFPSISSEYYNDYYDTTITDDANYFRSIAGLDGSSPRFLDSLLRCGLQGDGGQDEAQSVQC
jgi:hypothetical protein